MEKELLPQSENAVNINFMTFNIRTIAKADTNERAWVNRRAAVVDYLSKSDSEIICMQEVKKAQYEYIRENISEKYEVLRFPNASDENAGGVAVAYNKEIFEVIKKKAFWLSETPDVESMGWDAAYKRICANLTFKHKEKGVTVDVFNVHLDHIGEVARNKGIELIMDKVKKCDNPVFVTGDFNTKSTAKCYSIAADYLQDCQKTAAESDDGVTYTNWGEIEDFSSTPIDFGFASRKSMKPLKFKICRDKWNGNNFYSDHYAVKTTVQIMF